MSIFHAALVWAARTTPEHIKRWFHANALLPGDRPPRPQADAGDAFGFAAVISLAAQGTSTRCSARVIPGDEGACARHMAMGFHQGWGKALDQRVAYMKQL